MTIRLRITTFVVAGVLACGLVAPAFASAQSSSQCGTTTSSSASTYGGQGTQISQIACPGEPTASSALPFTGLDIGLLVAAGAILVAAGIVLRWRLRHGAQ
jgi:hypothetical protein